MLPYIVVVYALGALVAYRVLSSLFIAFRRRTRARSLGCKEPTRYPQPWYDPLNFGEVKRVTRATREKSIPEYFRGRWDVIESACRRATDPHIFTSKIKFLGAEIIFTRDPKNVQAILATQFNDFRLGARRHGNFFPLLGNGIFTTDGKAWEHSRSMLRPSFARDRVSDLDLEDRNCSNLMKVLPTNSDGWTAKTDLQVLFFRLTLDSSTEFLFGESVNSQLAALHGASEKKSTDEAGFAYHFDLAQDYLARRARLNKWYRLIGGKEFDDSCKYCHDFIDHYVQLALKSSAVPRDSEKDAERKSKNKYIFLEELAQQTRDPIVLRSELLHILLAGRDTTASLLSWLFYLLARSPEKFKKLRTAIISDFGSFQDSKPNEDITFSSLKSCSYLQACLNEALRLFPVVPINGRVAARDTTLPRGGGHDGQSPIFVKAGQDVTYSIYVIHRSKELWGEDAGEFSPERWQGRKPGWEYLPFNGGPRICLGQQFALTSAGFATVRMLQRFDAIENLDPSPIVSHNATLTSCPGTGVQVRLHEAR